MQEKTVICEVCKREFSSTHPNIKYCSLECRAKGQSLKRVAWNVEHRNYYPQYMREYRARIKQTRQNDLAGT